MIQMPMVWIELREDVIGHDTVWSEGSRRLVLMDIAARWIANGVAVPVASKRRRPGVTEAPERAVIVAYETPE